MKNGKRLICLGLTLLLTAALLGGCDPTASNLSYDQAQESLTALLSRVNVHDVPLRLDIGSMDLTGPGAELPEISNYPYSVQGVAPVNVEIMASTEKAGPKMDGWLNVIAENFNKKGLLVPSGKKASVSIRPVASGLATEYIISGKHIPDAFSPANELWGDMIATMGVPIQEVEKRLAGNTAGILMSRKANSAFIAKNGEVTLSKVIDAVMAGEMLLGYTNPYVSSTGLNILTAMLKEFNPDSPLDEVATQRLEAFQAKVPPVAYTTAQMRESAKSGVLDAMIMEYQAYINESTLVDYVFTPFGVRHDNPVYVTGKLSDDETYALDLFIGFCHSQESQQEAKRYGFNANEDYAGQSTGMTGSQLFAAQQVWKEHKDGGRPVVAVFVADVSGSMEGTPIQQLRTSLINASQYIGEGNYVGLVSYSSEVYISLPIAAFSGQQRGYFAGAVKDLSAGGGTATYDGVLAGLELLVKAKQDIPDAKLMMFVLSDGAQNEGYDLDRIIPIVKGLGIPVHTIGYNANLEELGKLSQINEASTVNADDTNVVYNLRNVFNAQM